MQSLALACALLLAAPPVVEDAPIHTFPALHKSAPSDKPARRAHFTRFAIDPRASIGDRVRAARAALDTLAKDDVARVEGELLVARLEGVRGRIAARKSALGNARRLAKKKKDAREAKVAAIVDADAAHAAIARATKRHRADAPLSESERALVDTGTHEGALVEAGDHAAAARLALARAELLVKAAALDDALLASTRVIELASSSREAIVVEDAARRMRVRLFVKKGDRAKAAEEGLLADARPVVPPTESAFFAPPVRDFARSRATSELCFALAMEGGSCRAIEKKHALAPSFYDFSVEKSAEGFDPERGEVALHEATDHLFACVKKAANDRSLDARRLEIEWTVLHTGRAKKLALKPARLAGTPVDACVDDALSRVRYPRYDGELHHVVLPFDIGN
mgnify:CR=1 FL=1